MGGIFVKIVENVDVIIININFTTIINIIKNKILLRRNNFGKLPLCNLKYDRAPHMCGLCFPLCWRCSCIILGYVIGLFLAKYSILIISNFLIVAILISLTIVDGIKQYFYKIESTNFNRIFTGFLAGIGIANIKIIYPVITLLLNIF